MQANALLQRNFSRDCQPARAYLVQYDLPGAPQGESSEWFVNLELNSSSSSRFYGYGNVAFFKKSDVEGVDSRGVEEEQGGEKYYVSWIKDGESASCQGFSKLVEYVSDESKYGFISSITKKVIPVGSVGGGAYPSRFVKNGKFKVPPEIVGENGWSIGILGGKMGSDQDISKLTISIAGSVSD